MEEKKFICECGRSFDKIQGMTGHQKNCQTHKDIVKQKKEARRLPNGMFKCENPDCGKEHDGSYGSGRFCCEKCRHHYSALISNQTQIKNGTKKRSINFINFNRCSPHGTWKCSQCNLIFKTRAELYKHKRCQHECTHAWNKGLTKLTSQVIADASLKVSAALKNGYKTGKIHNVFDDPEKRQVICSKIKLAAKLNRKMGGRRKGAGRSKHGWYKGIWCDSSWELAWVIYNLDHKIEFKPYIGYFEYQFQNEIHKYYPDFILNDGTIVEIKGNETSDQWKAKLEQFPEDKCLQVIGKNEIGKYLNYVVEKYGKNFIQLYD